MIKTVKWLKSQKQFAELRFYSCLIDRFLFWFFCKTTNSQHHTITKNLSDAKVYKKSSFLDLPDPSTSGLPLYSLSLSFGRSEIKFSQFFIFLKTKKFCKMKRLQANISFRASSISIWKNSRNCPLFQTS